MSCNPDWTPSQQTRSRYLHMAITCRSMYRPADGVASGGRIRRPEEVDAGRNIPEQRNYLLSSRYPTPSSMPLQIRRFRQPGHWPYRLSGGDQEVTGGNCRFIRQGRDLNRYALTTAVGIVKQCAASGVVEDVVVFIFRHPCCT